MPQFLVAIHHPDDYQPGLVEDDAMRHDIDVLNDDMVAAGVRKFVGGLKPVAQARSIPQGGGEVTEAPTMLGTLHMGGLWVLECADLDEALAWGQKAAQACRAPVEVRPFFP